MTQAWRKLGLVFRPDGRTPWMASHAAQPTPLPLDEARVRVFFSPRDGASRAHIGWLDLDLSAAPRVVAVGERPALAPGPRGAFDDSGVSIGTAIRVEGKVRLYYLGWTLGTTVPFRNFIGAADGDGEVFARVSPAPVLERSAADPFSLGYPWVVADGGFWRLYYGSHIEWGARGLEMIHAIKLARSADGVAWHADGTIAVAPAGGEEYAVSRPTVIRDGLTWRMWYARRYERYRLGYAESRDGTRWTRRDDACGLTADPGGWEAGSLTYPAVFTLGGRIYMLYNGDGYGRSGFGIAVLA